jgi:hypothetical protein
VNSVSRAMVLPEVAPVNVSHYPLLDEVFESQILNASTSRREDHVQIRVFARICRLTLIRGTIVGNPRERGRVPTVARGVISFENGQDV